MSGICGIVALDGKQASEADILSMAHALERRGPDGTSHWNKGEVALGHTLLATTPEALIEKLPLTCSISDCTITADVRLDNREDLFTRLGLSEDRPPIGDGELILLAYLKWGEACVDHLLGDFAFAIWDARQQKLLCARDQVGMRQLIYCHQPGSAFVFATEPNAVLEHPYVQRQINEGRIADYLEGLEAYDLTSTFFEGIHRLPPAHTLVLLSGEIRIRRYWTLAPQPALNLPNDEAYAAAFLEVFTEAVRGRLRSPAPIGSMLSGGMDSGSVSAVAARLLKGVGQGPLRTFSATSTNQACVETRTILAAGTINNISPEHVSLADLSTHRIDLQQLTADSDEPFDGHMTLIRAVYLAAHQNGFKVMLDGVGGDTTLASGGMVSRYLKRGEYRRAWREALGEERFWGPALKARRGFVVSAIQTFVPKPLRDWRRACLHAWMRWGHARTSIFNPDFAARVDMASRRRANDANVSIIENGDTASRGRRMLHPYVIVARERYDRVASALAIEPRDPFLDIRLLQFCASLPSDQLQADGWPKIVLRRAMAGVLPDEVRWRVGKEHLGWDFTTTTFQQDVPAASDENFANLDPYIRRNGHKPARGSDARKEEIAFSMNLRYLSAWIRINSPT